jgi:hypothetical protein
MRTCCIPSKKFYVESTYWKRKPRWSGHVLMITCRLRKSVYDWKNTDNVIPERRWGRLREIPSTSSVTSLIDVSNTRSGHFFCDRFQLRKRVCDWNNSEYQPPEPRPRCRSYVCKERHIRTFSLMTSS